MTTNPRSDSVNGRELIAFRLGQQEFCVDVMNVREIRGWTPATQLPHAPSYILGVINLRGMVLPIIDLAARMGFPPAEPSTRHAIMVVEIGKQVIGFLVDAVTEIFSGGDEDIQPTPEVASDMTRTLIDGVIPAEGRMISVLSLDTITATSELAA
ncbi:chemotaxis protein CheW [Hyphomicrobium sp. 2TAF46]|uniref:chemotaxis protein CheW n=1 Tax=Hyphomicrobium sp. 2TAF46 TaxID=3233019 RepID=UPI003F9298BA